MDRTRVRWGRVVVVALSVALGVAGLVGRAGAGSPTRPASLQVHVVRPGETLWGVARGVVGPAGDPRPEVDGLIEANHLSDAFIQPGQRLVLPAR